MPPKSKPTKDLKDAPTKSSIEEETSDVTDKPANEPEGPLPGPSTSAGFSTTKPSLADMPILTQEDIRKCPFIRNDSETILVFERDVEDPVASEVEKMHKAKEPFEKILVFHLGKRRFSDEQRKRWVDLINEVRRNRSLSSVPTDYETEASKEVAHLKFSPEEIKKFCEKYQNEDFWDFTESGEKSKTECNTSSDSEPEKTESEKKSPRLTPRRSPRHQGVARKGSWKEYKKGKNFASAYLKHQFEHSGVKNVIKKIVKEIYRKKKKQLLKKKEKFSIEVGKDEVHDLLIDAAGFMADRYVNKIKAEALKVYPPDDSPFVASGCESGTYDSQDEWYPNKETACSRLNKMSMSIPPSTLQEHGLLDILISILPMTINDFDTESVLEYVDILKMARHRVPDHIVIRSPPRVTPEKVKPSKVQTIVCTAEIELPPDLDRLKKTGAEGYLKQIPTQDDDESNSITDGVEKSLKLESRDSEAESSIKIEITEASGDTKFIDETSAGEADSTEHLKRDHSPKSPDSQSKKKAHEN